MIEFLMRIGFITSRSHFVLTHKIGSIGFQLIYLLINNYLWYLNAIIIKCRFIE